MSVSIAKGIILYNGGFFVSRGVGLHPDRIITSYEVLFVVKGILGIVEDETEYKVHPGQFLILYPHLRHYGNLPYAPDLQFFWLHFHYHNVKGDLSISIPKYAGIENQERVKQLFRWYLDDRENIEQSTEKAVLLINHILIELSTQAEKTPHKGALPYLLEQVAIIIATHFDKEISTKKISETVQCNPDYLGRIFKQHFGCTITESIQRQRIKYAKTELMNTCDHVNTIAYSCGFKDVGYFRRIFKALTGVTPGAYRKTFSRIHINT